MIHVSDRDLVRRVWEVEGIPVIDSSLDFRVEIDQVGVMRRSAETRGLDLGSWGSERTVMMRGMSWGVCIDIVLVWFSVVKLWSGGWECIGVV